MCKYVPKLKEALLELATKPMSGSLFDETVESIRNVLEAAECSLWSLNRNITEKSKTGDDKNPLSTSLLSRSVDVEYSFDKTSDFVHKLNKSFFGEVVKSVHNECYRCGLGDITIHKHKSMKFVNDLGLTDFIVIPVTDIYEKDNIVAIFEISYRESFIDDDGWQKCTPIIKTFFSTAFHRNNVLLNDNLQRVYGQYEGGNFKSFYGNLINTEFKKFFDYEGSSFFIWDSYSNRFAPTATTDDSIDFNDSKYFYSKSEGSTGWVGNTGKPIITDNIDIDKCKWAEKTFHKAKTSMIIPIKHPANQSEVIGILRFLNKKNKCNPRFIDYFNEIDLKLVQSYAKSLSLIIYYYSKEEDQVNLISKLAHEFKTPANAIFKSTDRLLDSIKHEDYDLLKKNLEKYLVNISDFSQIQKWQAETTLYSTRKQQQRTRYKEKNCSLRNILKRSRDIVRPIARQEGVTFDNIEIHHPAGSDIFLQVDEDAFVIVFYNLLSNAIKYHVLDYPESFHVDIWYTESDVAVEILVDDYGIGMDKKDKESVFQMGYRGERAMRENATGFGVGLSVVQQIVTDFGGIVNVKSCKNPTSFEILLPKTLIS